MRLLPGAGAVPATQTAIPVDPAATEDAWVAQAELEVIEDFDADESLIEDLDIRWGV